MDGSLVPRGHRAKYLGTLLTDSVDNNAEVLSRITEVWGTCAKLKLFWNKANTTLQWKLRVFDAIIKSKLLYGLETIQLTMNERQRLDSVQMKGYRRILKVPPTYIDRTWTNQRVIESLTTSHNLKFERFSETWKFRKVKLLGHIIRSHRYDPLRQVLYEKGTLMPRIEHKRRVGKPRANWLIETYNDAYRKLGLSQPFDISDSEHTHAVHEAAITRKI